MQQEYRVVSVALTASAVSKGLGLVPQAVAEAYAELRGSLLARNRYLTLDRLASMEASPEQFHSSGSVAAELEELSDVVEQPDLVAQAEELQSVARELLTEHAVSAADTRLMVLLSDLARDLREFTRCEDWLVRAAELGDTTAILTLVHMLEDYERSTEAEEWLRRAVGLGDVQAMIMLAKRFEDDEHRQLEVEDLSRGAAAAGDAGAMAWLGDAAAKRSATEEAEMWMHNAYHAGHHNGPVLLELFYFGSWAFTSHYLAAAEAGDPKAMRCRAFKLRKDGDDSTAEQWYRRAIDAGDTIAMSELSLLLAADPSRLSEGEDWARRAADTGYLPAVVSLGHFLHRRGAHPEAAQCYRRAAEAGYLDAKQALEHVESSHPAPRPVLGSAPSTGTSPSARIC